MSARRALVLVAMRDATERAAAEAALRAAGHATVAAGDGLRALRLYQRYHRVVDVVVADLRLPGMPGRELVSILRWAHAPVRVLVCGAYGPDEVSDRAALGADTPYLPSPWAVRHLLARVKQALTEPASFPAFRRPAELDPATTMAPS